MYTVGQWQDLNPSLSHSSLPSHMASQGPLQLKIGRKGNARPESNKHCFQVALRCHFTCEFNVVTECQENEAMFLRTEVQLGLQDGPRNNTTVNYLDVYFTIRSTAHCYFHFRTVENQWKTKEMFWFAEVHLGGSEQEFCPASADPCPSYLLELFHSLKVQPLLF